MKLPSSYEYWDDAQRIAYHTRMIHLYGIGVGICYVVIVISGIVLLAILGDFVFGWTG